MRIGVYSLKNILYQGDAMSINCATSSGEITVLDNHRPLVSILKPGTLTIIDKENKTHYIPVSSGFLEVRSESEVRIIVEEGELR